MIIVSTAIGNALYSKIPGAAIDASSGLWSIPCASVPTLPNIAFVMNGISFQLTPSQYILPQYLVGLIDIDCNAQVEFSLIKMQFHIRIHIGVPQIQMRA